MSSQHPPSQGRTLTFGIEFEFMVAKRIAGQPDPHPEEIRYVFPPAIFANSVGVSPAEQAQCYVVALLKDHGIPALSQVRLEDGDYENEESDLGIVENLRQEAYSQGVIVDSGHVATHAFWMVSEDIGITRIESQDVAGYEFVAMEVASRVLKETQFREVEMVYSLIKSNLRTQVNESCGLHIHVGIDHLSLESAKKLVTLLMILEEKGLFGDICAPHRASSDWCTPVSERSRAVMCGGSQSRDLTNARLVSHVPQLYNGVTTALRAGLTHIWNCQNIQGVAMETRVHGDTLGFNEDDTWNYRGGFAIRKGTVGFDIQGGDAIADMTIEFRYKESTGSASHDQHWLKLCLGFVRAAEWPVDRFQRAMWNLHEARNLESSLASLGVEEGQVRWWSAIARHHRENPRSTRLTRFLAAE